MAVSWSSGRCLRLATLVTAMAIVAAAATRAGTPVAASAVAGGRVATRLDFALLLVVAITGPAGRQLGGFDFLGTSAAGRSCSAGLGGGFGVCLGSGLVQRPLGRLRLFGLLGSQHLGRRIHHGADGFCLGQGLAAALFQFLGAIGFLVQTGLALGFRLGLGFCFSGFGLGLGFGSSALAGFGGLTGSGLAFGAGSTGVLDGSDFGFGAGTGFGTGLFRIDRFGSLLGSSRLGRSTGFGFGAGTLFGFALFLFLTLAAALGQLFFLATDQLGLAAGFFLAAQQLFRIHSRSGGCSSLGSFGLVFVTLDQRALLAHFHLDGAGTAGCVGLLDLAGGLLGQHDLLAFGARSMGGAQVVTQLQLVGLAQGIGGGVLVHAGALELVQQGLRRLVQFCCKFGDGCICHMVAHPFPYA